VNRLHDDSDDNEEPVRHGGDREITLGTTMILLIFFALAVYGAALFGFGYSLGSKHSGESAGAVAAQPASSASFSTVKPSPGSPVGTPSAEKPPAAGATVTIPYTAPAPVKPDSLPSASAKAAVETADAEDTRNKAVPVATPIATPAGTPPAPVPVAGFGNVVVQVAAVSHQEDADLIASTLKRRGYVVNIKTEADKLLHVQVGPFSTRKDAEVMKAKLLADGFNAYIK